MRLFIYNAMVRGSVEIWGPKRMVWSSCTLAAGGAVPAYRAVRLTSYPTNEAEFTNRLDINQARSISLEGFIEMKADDYSCRSSSNMTGLLGYGRWKT